MQAKRRAPFFENDAIRVVLESSRDAVIITSPELDAPGPLIQYVNAAFERMTGYSRAEVIGQSPRILQGARTDSEDLRSLKRQLLTTGGFEGNIVNYRKDRSEYIIDWSIAAIRAVDGTVASWLALQRDITEELRTQVLRRRAEDAERRLRVLVNGIPQLVWRCSEPGNWSWASEQWSIYTGLSMDESRGTGWLSAVHPDDRSAAIRAWKAAETHHRFEADHRLRGADGAYRWFQTRALPLETQTGEIMEWFGTSTDVDDLRRLESRQRMLVGELQHRTRNLIGVVQAIAEETLGNGQTQRVFGDRLSALGRAQGFIARASQQAIGLEEIVRVELAAHGREVDGERIRIEGPPVRLRPVTIQVLSLAIHELATNALKHGALSRPGGRLIVSWEPARAGSMLALSWSESGVQLIKAAPLVRGFGLDLIESSVVYELHARSELHFAQDGLTCRIELPLSGTSPELLA